MFGDFIIFLLRNVLTALAKLLLWLVGRAVDNVLARYFYEDLGFHLVVLAFWSTWFYLLPSWHGFWTPTWQALVTGIPLVASYHFLPSIPGLRSAVRCDFDADGAVSIFTEAPWSRFVKQAGRYVIASATYMLPLSIAMCCALLIRELHIAAALEAVAWFWVFLAVILIYLMVTLAMPMVVPVGLCVLAWKISRKKNVAENILCIAIVIEVIAGYFDVLQSRTIMLHLMKKNFVEPMAELWAHSGMMAILSSLK